MDQKMWDKGLCIRKAVPGGAYVANAMKDVDSFRIAREVFEGIDKA
jgi:hypothetical protein